MTPTRAVSKALGEKATGGSEGKSLVGHESSQGQQGRVYDPVPKDNIFGKKYNAIGVVGRSTSKTQLWPWTKPSSAWKISTEAGSRPCGSKAKQGSNGMRPGGVRSDATVVGRGLVALSGCMGHSASTHNLCAMECLRADTGRMVSSSSSFWRRSQWSSGS